MPIAINFSSVGIYNEEFPSMNSPDPLITWSQKSHLKYFSSCITTTTSPMATKLSKVATYYNDYRQHRCHQLFVAVFSIHDFNDLAIWSIEGVCSDFSKVSM